MSDYAMHPFMNGWMITQKDLLTLSRAKSKRCKELLLPYCESAEKRLHPLLMRTLNQDLELHYLLRYPMYNTTEAQFQMALPAIKEWCPEPDLETWILNQCDTSDITSLLKQESVERAGRADTF